MSAMRKLQIMWRVQIILILLLGVVVASVASIDPPSTMTMLQIEQRIQSNTKRIEALSLEINRMQQTIAPIPTITEDN